MKYKLDRLEMSEGPDPDENDLIEIAECVLNLDHAENSVLSGTLYRLEEEIGRDTERKGRNRTECDNCFGEFSHFILEPYANAGMASRAAAFSETKLIPAVIALEKAKAYEFHKGALFYNTALAFLISGDESRFEFYLAMTDEEDFRTHGVEGKSQVRGMHNKKQGPLTSQTIQASVRFAVSLANGAILSSCCPLASVLNAPLTDTKFNTWRAGLDVLHHGELFRSLNELRLFCGDGGPDYPAVLDNPSVMLRLGKVLAHIAQWTESQLTLLQAGSVTGETLHPKLANDPNLSPLAAVAGIDSGGVNRFPGRSVRGTGVDVELRSLLADIPLQTTADERAWRVLRVLYIIRNSTAHQIEPSLAFYTDRQYLLDLIQVTLVAALVIQQRKGIVVV